MYGESLTTVCRRLSFTPTAVDRRVTCPDMTSSTWRPVDVINGGGCLSPVRRLAGPRCYSRLVANRRCLRDAVTSRPPYCGHVFPVGDEANATQPTGTTTLSAERRDALRFRTAGDVTEASLPFSRLGHVTQNGFPTWSSASLRALAALRVALPARATRPDVVLLPLLLERRADLQHGDLQRPATAELITSSPKPLSFATSSQGTDLPFLAPPGLPHPDLRRRTSVDQRRLATCEQRDSNLDLQPPPARTYTVKTEFHYRVVQK